MTLAHRVSAYNRARKHRLLKGVIPENGLILDAGFADLEHSPSDNFLERAYPNTWRIVGLSLEHGAAFRRRYPGVRAVQYAGGPMPFADGAFELCWSNAVIEHVGDRDAQIAYLREMLRVARRVVFTTPNRRFPVEVHTRTPLLHLGPLRLFETYLHLIGKGWATNGYMNLLAEADLRELLREVGHPQARIHRNRLAGLTMDFLVIVQ